MQLRITNLTKFLTLLLLYEKPRHGYEIIKDVGSKLGQNVSPGQIYPFLAALEKQGYIKAKKHKIKDKKVYTLTKKGKDFVGEMFTRFGDILDVAVESNISVCAHCSCEVYKGVYKKKIRGKNLPFCCESCAKSYRPR